MFYCQKCWKPLNEFDVKFTQKMYRTKDFRKCNCFKCSVGEQNYENLSKMKKTKNNILIFSLWLGIAIPSLISYLILEPLPYDAIPEFLAGITIGGAVLAVYGTFFVGYWVVKSFDIKESEGYYTGKTIVTLEKNGENSWTKKEEAEYISGDDGFFGKAFLVLTAMFWLAPYILYATTKYIWFSSCPSDLKKIYHDLQKEQSPLSLDKKAGKLHKQQKDYRKKVNNIRAKYHYLDERSLKVKINDVMYPMCVVPIVPKKQCVSRCWMFQTTAAFPAKQGLAFILFKNKDGTFDGMIHEIEGYPIHLTDYWEEEFKTFGIDRETVDAAMRGFEQREQIINSSSILSRFV